MKALRGRIMRGLAWRWSEANRHIGDVTGAVRYALQRVSGGLQVTKGQCAPGARMALYVIFPRDGLLDSHLLALRSLRASGYVPLVVSNLGLDAQARDALAPLVWQVIERPNFGYDFGGYREGMRALRPYLGQMERLVLLNDSVWYPLSADQDWPAQAEARGADVVGAVSNYGVPFPESLSLDGFRWRYDISLPEFHYCSFALSFGPAALRHPVFRRFWRRIRLTNNKFHTVRRGEVALSRALISAGLSHAETFDTSGLGARLGRLSQPELHRMLGQLVIPEDPRLETMRQRILSEPDGPGQRARLESAVLGIIALTGPAYALPAYAHDVLGHPFLKKSPLRLARSAAEATLDLTQRLPGEGGAIIHAEARALAGQ